MSPKLINLRLRDIECIKKIAWQVVEKTRAKEQTLANQYNLYNELRNTLDGVYFVLLNIVGLSDCEHNRRLVYSELEKLDKELNNLHD